MHLTFLDGAAERIHYGSCQANCDDPASWNLIQLTSNVQLGTTTAGPYGLGVDTSGRIHLLVSTVTGLGNSANALVYLTCVSNCASAASWTQLDLSTLAPGSSTINTNSTFMVEPNGRVSFLTSGQYNSYSAVYLACGGSCTSLGSWSAGVVLNGNPLYAVQDATGMTHVSLRLGDSAANENLLYYARCASNCVTAASWEISAVGFLHRVGDWSTAFAVTPGGRVFMSYNQGEITVNTADNRKMYVNSCAGSTCLDLNTWQGFTVGDLDEGAEGSWLEPTGEGMVLASVSGFELRLRTCATNCGAGGSWSGATLVDSSDAMNQSFPPDTGSACMGTSESASWWPGSPTVGVGPRGTVVVHNPDAIVKCPGDPSPDRLPNIGRVVSTY